MTQDDVDHVRVANDHDHGVGRVSMGAIMSYYWKRDFISTPTITTDTLGGFSATIIADHTTDTLVRTQVWSSWELSLQRPVSTVVVDPSWWQLLDFSFAVWSDQGQGSLPVPIPLAGGEDTADYVLYERVFPVAYNNGLTRPTANLPVYSTSLRPPTGMVESKAIRKNKDFSSLQTIYYCWNIGAINGPDVAELLSGVGTVAGQVGTMACLFKTAD